MIDDWMKLLEQADQWDINCIIVLLCNIGDTFKRRNVKRDVGSYRHRSE